MIFGYGHAENIVTAHARPFNRFLRSNYRTITKLQLKIQAFRKKSEVLNINELYLQISKIKQE